MAPSRPGRCGAPPRTKAAVVLSKRQLERLYVHDGLSLKQLGLLFEVPPDTVARNLDRYGIPPGRPPLDWETLIRLYVGGGLGIRGVADRLGVSPGTVKRDLAHHGIPVRRLVRPPAR